MGYIQVALGLALVAAVQSQLDVFATWNGTRIDNPIVVYHDEVLVDPGPSYSIGDTNARSALVCTSTTRARTAWRRADHGFFDDVTARVSTNSFNQIRTSSSTVPSLSRLSRNSEGLRPTAPSQNGLWACRVNVVEEDGPEGLQDVLDSIVFVGLYNRGMGAITNNEVSLSSSSSFTGNSPTFTLFGNTSGGPPANNRWRRDGVDITNRSMVIGDGSPFSISTRVNTVPTDNATPENRDAYLNARYRSTLTVTGFQPGVYQYSADNRVRFAVFFTDSITIEGGEVTDFSVSQTDFNGGLGVVVVDWTPPAFPPQDGYRVTVGNTQETVSAPPHTISISEFGVLDVRVESLSRHYPIATVQMSLTVRGALPPLVTVSAVDLTSATISWVLQDFSFPLIQYTYTLTRRTGSNQPLCPNVQDARPAVTTNDVSATFTGLDEFSIYRFSLFARFNAFNTQLNSEMVVMDFTTPSTTPTGTPSVMSPIINARMIMVTWTEIDCIDRHGIITGYAVEFQEQGGAGIPGEVVDRTFMASGLTPGRDFTFRVAGVNINGTGTFTDPMMISTNEEPPGPVSNLVAETKFTSVWITWDAPQEPNGVITRYEVTYRVNDGDLQANDTNVATNLTLLSLTPGTNVSGISVVAFTGAGRGSVLTAPNLMIDLNPQPPTVSNVQVVEVSDTSVMVSWDAVVIPEVIGYTVFYSQIVSRKRQLQEQSVNVSADQTSVVIGDLERFVQYQFQVVAIAELNGMTFVGDRSAVGDDAIFPSTTPTPPPSSGGGTPVGAVIGGIVLAIAVVAGIVLLVLFILWFRRRRSHSASHKPMIDSVRYAKAGTLTNMEKQAVEPSIEEFPDDTQAIEGESVVFKVVVSGKPLPTLTWYHDGIELITNYAQEILDDGSLNIATIQTKQAGVYKLIAANSVGSTEQDVKLTVQFEGEKTPDVERKSMTFAPVPVVEFGDYVVLNHNSNNQGFRDQFQGLDTGEEYPKTIGLSPEYKKLNRFANITNYDHNHIVLAPMQGQADCDREFINGCYIDGYSVPKKFIATQGPIPRSLIDFWRLVWQERPPTIVMVTNLKEGNKKKCVQYWPDTGSTTFGPFKVTLTEHEMFADYCIRTMQVTAQGGKPLKLQQFHFTAWPDHGVPDYATPMLAFHRRIASTHNPRRGPILAHCSAGVGRTGTFICINNVLEQIKKEEVVDIAGAINKMRHQRMKMVQTPEQYIFLHDAMLESVTCGDTQITAADLRLKIKKYDKVDASTGITTFQSQFNVLDQVSPKISEVVCKSGSENPDRNRRTDYLPADRFRVLLKGEHPDYIHAAFAHGYKHQKAYIVAEGPMLSTVRNMLKILYDRKVGAIVMLSGFTENGVESSVQYWPPAEKLVKFGEYTVDLINEEALEGFTIRTLSILEHATDKAHQVTQFHITCWAPDGQCSNLRAVVDCIEEVAKIQRRTGNKPIFVHCGDTVTRSGMFCAMATVIDRCKTEGVVDVFQVVKALRVQKPGAVPTMENYKTIFESILTFLDSFDTYANFQNV